MHTTIDNSSSTVKARPEALFRPPPNCQVAKSVLAKIWNDDNYITGPLCEPSAVKIYFIAIAADKAPAVKKKNHGEWWV